jgi:hypothetical protein
MVMSPAGLGHENDCAGEVQQQLYVNYRQILPSESILHKDYDRKCSDEKKISLVMSLKGLAAEMYSLAVKSQS